MSDPILTFIDATGNACWQSHSQTAARYPPIRFSMICTDSAKKPALMLPFC